jgi:hypothetical protein
MSATALTPLKLVSPFGPGPGAGGATAAADTSNGNSFANDGKTNLLVTNSDASGHAFTFSGKSFTVPAERSIVLGPFPVYSQYGATVNVTGSDTHLSFLVFSAPNGSGAQR